MIFKDLNANGTAIKEFFGARIERAVIFACASLILVHFVVSFLPHLRLWGINQLHYFPLEFRIVISTIGLLILVPKVNKILAEFLTRVFTSVAEKFERMNKYLKYSFYKIDSKPNLS